MRISDWSSDVCSSDLHLDRLITDCGTGCDYRPGLLHGDHRRRHVAATRRHVAHLRDHYGYTSLRAVERDEIAALVATRDYHGGSLVMRGGHQIGRAHVCTPVTNAHLVFRLLLENQKKIIT